MVGSVPVGPALRLERKGSEASFRRTDRTGPLRSVSVHTERNTFLAFHSNKRGLVDTGLDRIADQSFMYKCLRLEYRQRLFINKGVTSRVLGNLLGDICGCGLCPLHSGSFG